MPAVTKIHATDNAKVHHIKLKTIYVSLDGRIYIWYYFQSPEFPNGALGVSPSAEWLGRHLIQ